MALKKKSIPSTCYKMVHMRPSYQQASLILSNDNNNNYLIEWFVLLDIIVCINKLC